MEILPNDILRALLENAKSIQITNKPTIENSSLEFVREALKHYDSMKIAEALSVIETLPYSQIKESIESTWNSINKKYYENIIDTYPDLYFKYSNNTKNICISDKTENGNTIPIENAKDLVILKNIINGLTFEECSDFINYLSKFPMLGYKHRIGKKVDEYIRSCPQTNIQNITAYRIRVSTSLKQIAYTENEMFEPQYTMPKQNRFSMVGLNPLYLSGKLETAMLETELNEADKYTWIKLLIKNKFSVLDITDENVPLFRVCHKKAAHGSANMYVEYLFPNYISDCARACGFEGIIYNSVRDNKIPNYVLFDAGRRDFNVIEIKGHNYEKI